MIFWSAAVVPYGIFRIAADGSSAQTLVYHAKGDTGNADLSPDGALVILDEDFGSGGSADILIVDLEGGSPARVWQGSDADERYAAFSPDGRWVAYTSNESGTYEVYVAPFPGPGSSWLISSGGGRRSHWSHDGRQLFYLNGERLFEVEVEVEVEVEEGLRARQPRLLFELPGAQGDFDVAHDREGFLMIRAVPMESPDEHRIEVALNWAQRLERGGRD